MPLPRRVIILIGIGVLVLGAVIVTVIAFTGRAGSSSQRASNSSSIGSSNTRSQDSSTTDSAPRVQRAAAIDTLTPRAPISTTNTTPIPSPIPLITASPVRAVLGTFKASGNLVSANQATLAFQTSGRVKEIRVKESERIKAGIVIVALETSALDAQVTQAQATLDSAVAALAKVKAGPTLDDIAIAKSNLDRAKATMDQAQAAYDRIGGASYPTIGLTQQALTLQQATSSYQAALAQYNLSVNHPTLSELKAAEATVAQAQAALESAKQNANNARIVAPFDGTVIWIGPKIGESVTSGTSAVTIADLTRMQVLANVDEITASSIQIGQTATIRIDALFGRVLTGHVLKTGMLATSSGSLVTIPVTVDIDPTDAPLYPGLSASVEFQGATP